MCDNEIVEIGEVVRIEFDEELYQKNLEEFDWDSVEPENGRGDDLVEDSSN